MIDNWILNCIALWTMDMKFFSFVSFFVHNIKQQTNKKGREEFSMNLIRKHHSENIIVPITLQEQMIIQNWPSINEKRQWL